MERITVVGGGLAGLIAAIECAEAGAPVTLLEARSRMGGRAVSTSAPFVANFGPHAFYKGPLWSWLRRRGLHRPVRIPKSPAIRFRWRGEIYRTPPRPLGRGILHLRGEPPVEASFREWMADRADDEVAVATANLGGPLTFDPQPGRLSAAFLAQRIRRILLRFPPSARYVVGGWGSVVERLARHARETGVEIHTRSRVDDIEDLDGGPVIVAVEPAAARELLGDPDLRVESPTVLLYDLGLESRRGDPYLLFDLDEAAFFTTPSVVHRSFAPRGHRLVQTMVGMRPGESRVDAETRLECLFDAVFGDWRSRLAWTRRAVVRESTGALDLPGHTWRDRPALEHQPRVWLAGDWVAAPGHLSEVSYASGVAAARSALEAAAHPATRSGTSSKNRPA